MKPQPWTEISPAFDTGVARGAADVPLIWLSSTRSSFLLLNRLGNCSVGVFGPKFRGAVALAAIDGVRVRCELCIINGRESGAEFLVRLAGVCRLNRNGHVLE